MVVTQPEEDWRYLCCKNSVNTWVVADGAYHSTSDLRV